MKKSFPPPQPGERCAYVQPFSQKRAALLFDRIYTRVSFFGEIPDELLFEVPNAYLHFETVYNEWSRDFLDTVSQSNGLTEDDVKNLMSEFDVRLHVDSFRRCGYNVTPVYDRQSRFFADFPSGPALVYQAAIQNLPEIIENKVSWAQLIEFREDRDALRKYRALRLWLEDSVRVGTVEKAKELIAKKIDDYEWALKKHGLETTAGAFSAVIDWKAIASLMGSAGIAGVVGGPVWSAITGGLFSVAKLSVWIVERMIKRSEIERSEGAEIAIIYDAKKKLGK